MGALALGLAALLFDLLRRLPAEPAPSETPAETGGVG
jgi:hypothetical protein